MVQEYIPLDSSAYKFTDPELVRSDSPFIQQPTDSSRWSTSVNHLGLDNTIVEDVELSPTIGPFPLLSSQNPAIESNLDNADTADSIQAQLSDSASPNSSLETVREVTMNERDYDAKYMALDGMTVSIETLIAMFNQDTVSLIDLGDYREELQRIFQSFLDFEKKYLKLRGQLDRNNETDVLRLTDLKALHERMKKRVVDNQVEVKKKLEELQAANSSGTARETDKVAVDKVKLKVKHVTDKFKDLKKQIDDLGEVDAMSEHKVRECLVDTKEWKKDLRAYRDSKESIDLELISVEIDAELKTDFETKYKEMVDTVNKMITDLNKVDKDLGLYALSDVKSKAAVQYPEPFSGMLGENVFKFVKEFEDAIAADHIRKADEVKTLIKYLKGSAKASIGEHHSKLEDALEQLKDNYGSPRLIVDKYLKDFEKSLGHIKNWGKHGSKERVDAINKTLDFLRNLESLVKDHPDHLKSEIYSSATLLILTKGMPHESSKKFGYVEVRSL